MNAARAQVPHTVPNTGQALEREFLLQREYTLALYAAIPDVLWTPARVPYVRIVNPPLWEWSHIAWFAEYFALRHPRFLSEGVMPPSRLKGADDLFNSSLVAHAERWRLTYPSVEACLAYMEQVLEDVTQAALATGDRSPYRFQLALLHEDMHAEALAMALRTLGLPFPEAVPAETPLKGLAGDLEMGGGPLIMGNGAGRHFLFDNEKPARDVEVQPFAIDKEPVSAADFAAFCQGTAYTDPSYWSDAGWRWQKENPPRKQPGTRLAVAMHVSYFEAEAFCRWAGRRLPTEAEWEFAAVHSPAFFASTGAVWEWTADTFAPFPGFAPDVYHDYSQPWFHNHQVLKGGSFATHPRLKYPQYRNFYTPERRDMFCGFRTCAPN